MSRPLGIGRFLTAGACLVLVGACSGDQTPQDRSGERRSGPSRDFNENDEGIFGTWGGVGIGQVFAGDLGGSDADDGDSLPVNKFLWQASLDTLSFLPLASTDPFTGVIATDWGASPTSAGERFKVTAYMVRPALSASSLKVAVYRELRNPEGIWVPAPVSPETAVKLEDAILVRARQIKIADLDGNAAG